MRNRSVVAIVAAGLLGAVSATPASAADFGGNCCADLEERIAELEATTVRKGNRKVSLTLYGSVNQSILYWDDEEESNAYVVDNIGLPTYFGLTGEANIAAGWKAGYKMEIWTGSIYSSTVNQVTDDGVAFPWDRLYIWQNHWYVQSDHLGKVSLGVASRASDAAPEQDLSGTADATYSLVSDIGFGFLLRRSNDGLLSNLAWGSFSGYNFTGETGNIIRYDSPTVAGFTFVASWGEDDMTDVGLYYAGEHAGFTINAGVAYAHTTDENGLYGNFPEFPGPLTVADTQHIETDTVTGSISILHNPTGLNATIAAGTRDFGGTSVNDTPVQLGLGTAAVTPADTSYIWAKVGWIAKFSHLGATNFYGEYGYYEDGLTATGDLNADGSFIASLSADGVVCAGNAGEACRIKSSESEIWGFGVVQNIDAAEMKLYTGFRQWSGEVDLVDINGDPVADAGFNDFWHIISGARISF